MRGASQLYFFTFFARNFCPPAPAPHPFFDECGAAITAPIPKLCGDADYGFARFSVNPIAKRYFDLHGDKVARRGLLGKRKEARCHIKIERAFHSIRAMIAGAFYSEDTGADLPPPQFREFVPPLAGSMADGIGMRKVIGRSQFHGLNIGRARVFVKHVFGSNPFRGVAAGVCTRNSDLGLRLLHMATFASAYAPTCRAQWFADFSPGFALWRDAPISVKIGREMSFPDFVSLLHFRSPIGLMRFAYPPSGVSITSWAIH